MVLAECGSPRLKCPSRRSHRSDSVNGGLGACQAPQTPCHQYRNLSKMRIFTTPVRISRSNHAALRFLRLASSAAHPHDLVLPLSRLHSRTTLVAPQRHSQYHCRMIQPLLHTVLSACDLTVRRPNSWPVIPRPPSRPRSRGARGGRRRWSAPRLRARSQWSCLGTAGPPPAAPPRSARARRQPRSAGRRR